MKVKLSECQKQACLKFDRRVEAGAQRKENIHKASFIERRLFYLIGKLCYKEMQCD